MTSLIREYLPGLGKNGVKNCCVVER